MGNNSDTNPSYSSTGLTRQQFDTIARKIDYYINNRGVLLEETLTDDEMNWLKNQMIDSDTDPDINRSNNTPFIRFEQKDNSNKYEVGKPVPTTKEIQSYTRDEDISTFIKYGNGDLVLIVPQGNVKHYVPYKILEQHGGYEDTLKKYSTENESLINQKNQKVTKVEEFTGLKRMSDDFFKLSQEYGVPNKYINSVTIVYTESNE